MSVNIQELQERRNTLAATIQELAAVEEMDAEQRQQWETVNADYDGVVAEMEREQDRITRAARAAQIAERQEQQQFSRRTEVGEARQNRAGVVTEEHRALALQAWGMRARHRTSRHEEACQLTGVDPNDREFDAIISQPGDNLRGYGQWDRRGGHLSGSYEARGLTVGTDSEGGYTVPEGFSNELERALLAYGGPRRVCRVITTATGNPLPWPTTTDTGNVGERLAEEASIGSSVDPTFGVVTFNAYRYSSKPVLVTQDLIEDSAFNLGSLLASMLGERIGRITATEFTTGTGSSQPNGLSTAAGAGVTAASATAITADELIDLVHSLDPAYRGFGSCGFMFHDSTLQAIRKLKDGDNQYLWQPGLQSSEPDRLLGFPYTVNQAVAAIATGNISVLFGAMEKYVIRDCAMARFYRLEERYRDNDQTGFILFSRHDGDLLDAGTDPIVKLTQA